MITVEILTPVGKLHSGEYDEVLLPTTTGQIGVRTGHQELITVLKKGFITVKSDSGARQQFEITDGFAEILPKKVSIVSRSAQAA